MYSNSSLDDSYEKSNDNIPIKKFSFKLIHAMYVLLDYNLTCIIVKILGYENQIVRKNSVLDNSVSITGIVLHMWSSPPPICRYT